jgi:cytochrome P450
MEFRRDPVGVMLRSAREQGDIGSFRLGPIVLYQVNNPEYIHDILVGRGELFYRTALTKRIIGSIGDGLLSSDGDFHRRQRRLAQPAFHHKRIAAYADVMVDYSLRALDTWKAGHEYDIDKEMMKLTLNIVSKTLFDADVSQIAESLYDPITAILEITNDKFTAFIGFPSWLPTPRNRREKRAGDTLHDTVYGFINEHRASGIDRGDLLSMLMTSNEETDEQMTDNQLYIESLTMFLAGHETTAMALIWTWYLLSQHPEIEAKLHAELDSVLQGRAPTVQDLPQLRYTSMVVKETMRLYPPAWVISREPLEDVTFGPHPMKKGSIMLISPYVVHRDPRYYPDPERFDPERFAEGYEKRLPRFAYFPFGGGSHVCIGQPFAMMEATLVLATIAQRYRLQLAPDQRVEIQPLVTLRPKYGMRMKLSPR